MSNRKIITLEENCTGCFACANICPKDAISMPENYEGFYFPVIDSKVCIDCGLCDKICPAIEKPELKTLQKSFYAKAKDPHILKSSSSGGAFHMIATMVLNESGVVYGSSFNYNGLIRLECHSTDEVTLEELKKSKYVQSYVGDAYRRLKKDLERGVKVLFCGTPCQVAGLKSFLRKDYANLITVDFICHGVPSMSLLRKHLEYLGLKNISEICFRPKNRGWVDDFEIRYIKSNILKKNRIRRIPWRFDEYFDTFQKYQNIRRSCRDCAYCNGQRASDITLADFWGVSKYNPQLYDPKGLSLVLANTTLGINIIQTLKLNCQNIIEEIPSEYSAYVYGRIRTNPDSPYQSKLRDKFLKDVYTVGYKKALKINGLMTSKKDLLIYRIKSIAKIILKRNQ